MPVPDPPRTATPYVSVHSLDKRIVDVSNRVDPLKRIALSAHGAEPTRAAVSSETSQYGRSDATQLVVARRSADIILR